MQIRRHIVTEQVEETSDGESLVAVAQDVEVDAVFVEEVGEEGDDGVDGDHEEDADDAGRRRRVDWLAGGVLLVVCWWGNGEG